MRSVSCTMEEIYMTRYNNLDNMERTYLAIDMEDSDMMKECISQWSSDHNAHFLIDIFDIARKRRIMDIVCLLISYKGYEYISYGEYLYHDIDFIKMLFLDERTKEFIKKHIINRFIHPRNRYDLKESVKLYIGVHIQEYIMHDYVQLYGISASICLCIVCDYPEYMLPLIKYRLKILNVLYSAEELNLMCESIPSLIM